jgi:hypothetical protein
MELGTEVDNDLDHKKTKCLLLFAVQKLLKYKLTFFKIMLLFFFIVKKHHGNEKEENRFFVSILSTFNILNSYAHLQSLLLEFSLV